MFLKFTSRKNLSKSQSVKFFLFHSRLLRPLRGRIKSAEVANWRPASLTQFRMYALGYSRGGTIVGSIIYFIVTLLSKTRTSKNLIVILWLNLHVKFNFIWVLTIVQVELVVPLILEIKLTCILFLFVVLRPVTHYWFFWMGLRV